MQTTQADIVKYIRANTHTFIHTGKQAHINPSTQPSSQSYI